MTTIVNTPPSGESSDSGLGIILGVIVALILVALFFVYVFPTLRPNPVPQSGNIDVNVKLPAPVVNPAPVSPNP